VRRVTGSETLDANTYGGAFGVAPSAALRELVKRRLAGDPRLEDPIDDLLRAAPDHVLKWLRSRTLLADGTSPGVIVADPDSVLAVIAEMESELGAFDDGKRKRRLDLWSRLRIGLLRDLAAITFEEAGRLLSISPSHLHKLEREHRSLLVGMDEYARRAALLTSSALRRCWG
jgi:hypothetical protein